jgi:demethylmenaquinone methyltransferase/2-methoxy-6-polyprenyl-1,4-benzoquinol methylase
MKSTTTKSVQDIFSSQLSTTYDLVNHVLTFGLDSLWRRRAARIAAAAGGTQWADMCTGTGEMAVCLSRLAPPGTTVHAVDFSRPMMEVAKRKPEARKVVFIVSDVKALDFQDDRLDLITIAFATRNINLNRDVLAETFTEFHRVLKPGGWFINLETSQPSSRLIRWLFHAYIKLFVKPVGSLISGSTEGYAYLRHTIPRFYPPEELSEIMRRAGFENVTATKMMFGIAAIHKGMKGEAGGASGLPASR